MFDFDKNKERLAKDAHFKQLVDLLYFQAESLGWTPQELRDAACMASIKWAERHVEPKFLQSLLRLAPTTPACFSCREALPYGAGHFFGQNAWVKLRFTCGHWTLYACPKCKTKDACCTTCGRQEIFT